MTKDPEVDLFKEKVNCAAVLENAGPPWKLDCQESTRRALKYRRGKGEVLIVTQEGRGWWDPQSTARGDVFNLVQHLDPSLTFGHVRQVLRRLVGIAPSYTPAERRRGGEGDTRPVAQRWAARPRLRPGCRAWAYLAELRRLPRAVLELAGQQDVVRDGAYGSAWFAHRDGGVVTHVEVRGPTFKGSLRGGDKTLFRVRPSRGEAARLVITEAPIDALSVAAREGHRSDTLYVATGGGMGPHTIDALTEAFAALTSIPNTLVESAVDANLAGDRYADRHAELARAAGIRFSRLRPPEGLDWNEVLKREAGA
jgi:Toprim-like/Protein of unknown function (DUF3991)